MKLTNYSLKEIEKAYKSEKEVYVRERLHLILKLRENYQYRDIIQMLNISLGKITFWRKRFESEGFKGLYNKEGRGRKAELTDEELSMLASSLAEGYLMNNGYTRPYKTKDVRTFILDHFEIQYTVRHVRRLLQHMGLRLKVPRPRHKKRNQENVDEFKREFKKKVEN